MRHEDLLCQGHSAPPGDAASGGHGDGLCLLVRVPALASGSWAGGLQVPGRWAGALLPALPAQPRCPPRPPRVWPWQHQPSAKLNVSHCQRPAGPPASQPLLSHCHHGPGAGRAMPLAAGRPAVGQPQGSQAVPCPGTAAWLLSLVPVPAPYVATGPSVFSKQGDETVKAQNGGA